MGYNHAEKKEVQASSSSSGSSWRERSGPFNEKSKYREDTGNTTDTTNDMSATDKADGEDDMMEMQQTDKVRHDGMMELSRTSTVRHIGKLTLRGIDDDDPSYVFQVLQGCVLTITPETGGSHQPQSH